MPANSIYFPCFTNETFWVTATEHDSMNDEKTSVVLDCDSLQLGYNLVEISIYENMILELKTAEAYKESLWYTFNFSDDKSKTKPAVYQMLLMVTDVCTDFKIIKNYDDKLPGNWTQKVLSMEIENRIVTETTPPFEEIIAPEPILNQAILEPTVEEEPEIIQVTEVVNQTLVEFNNLVPTKVTSNSFMKFANQIESDSGHNIVVPIWAFIMMVLILVAMTGIAVTFTLMFIKMKINQET